MLALADLAALAAIAGATFAALIWLFKMATDVAVLKTQMAEVQPVKLARDISWIKGALHSLANVLRADLAEDPK